MTVPRISLRGALFATESCQTGTTPSVVRRALGPWPDASPGKGGPCWRRERSSDRRIGGASGGKLVVGGARIRGRSSRGGGVGVGRVACRRRAPPAFPRRRERTGWGRRPGNISSLLGRQLRPGGRIFSPIFRAHAQGIRRGGGGDRGQPAAAAGARVPRGSAGVDPVRAPGSAPGHQARGAGGGAGFRQASPLTAALGRGAYNCTQKFCVFSRCPLTRSFFDIRSGQDGRCCLPRNHPHRRVPVVNRTGPQFSRCTASREGAGDPGALR